MKHQAFSLSCARLLALLSSTPDSFPDVTPFIELAKGKGDVFHRFFPEDCSSPEALFEAVRTTLNNGCRARANYRTGARLYRRTRAHLLRLGFFGLAQDLESYWVGACQPWRKMACAKATPAAFTPTGELSPAASTTKAAPEVPPVAPAVVTPAPSRLGIRQMRLSHSQQKCSEKLMALAGLFFDPPAAAASGIPIQTNALLTGPTGSGKTLTVRRVAEDLHAEFLHLTHGSWIVEGAQDGRPTGRTILQLAANTTRSGLVLFIDELDKFGFGSSALSSWDISIRSDLWMLLDRALSWEAFAAKPDFVKTLPEQFRSAAALEELFKTKVFIVAAGTWQGLFNPPASMGFASQAATSTLDAATLNRHGGLPEEVLRRFNSDLLHLDYPTLFELEKLMDLDGLLALGRELGQEVDPVAQFEQVKINGMTVLSSLKTSLLVKQRSRVASLSLGTAP